MTSLSSGLTALSPPATPVGLGTAAGPAWTGVTLIGQDCAPPIVSPVAWNRLVRICKFHFLVSQAGKCVHQKMTYEDEMRLSRWDFSVYVAHHYFKSTSMCKYGFS